MIPWLAACFGCGDPTPAAETTDPHAHHRMPPAEAPTGSLYDLGLSLTTETGPVSLDHWRGQPLIVSQVYAGCQEVCPLTIEAIRAIEAQVPAVDVRVLLVSLDPKDTPADLKEVALARGADPIRWTFATGTPEAVRDLAAALGVRYRSLPDGSISHSVVIALLGPDGAIVERVDGLGTSSDALVARLGRGEGATPATNP